MGDLWNRRQVLRRLGATGIASVGSGTVCINAAGAGPNDRQTWPSWAATVRVTHAPRKTRVGPLVRHYRTDFPPAGFH
jgi:hypothetical protein